MANSTCVSPMVDGNAKFPEDVYVDYDDSWIKS
jgi:hypothetical protein